MKKIKKCAIIKNNELIKDVISKKYKIKIKEEKENNNEENNIINSDISNYNSPLSDDLRMKYSEINNLDKKIFYSNSKNKVNLNLLNQLLNKEKLDKFFDEKKLNIQKTQKNKDSLSYILPLTKKNISNKTEYKNRINNNRSQKKLELIKYGISNKDINELFLYNNNHDYK